ncbi:glycosyl transferase family 2 [Shewanella baltica OS183]|uniref:glycosyltransferase family 2 protein n=1 Tax=Shewanella baltica TaxID=62322 RepID=UPI0001E10F53|nr:glycosyltransferase family A protein [Shewanella baltica]EHQ15718.1 glycosyl transferase family 2 [Shewanella baltica OS183]
MKISILTATYNRGYLLPRLYESLVNQTNSSFEWIVVDDGSTDCTESYLKDCMLIGDIDIKYTKKDNGGKHSAINLAIDIADSDYCLLIDSDDYLKFDSVEIVLKSLVNLPADLAGACFRCEHIDGKMSGDSVNFDFLLWKRSTPTEFKNFINADSAYVFKTVNLKKFKFPIIYGEKFFPELYIWNQIAQNCGDIAYFYNTTVCIIEYQVDGLSSDFSKLIKNSPTAFLIYYKDIFRRETKIFNKFKYIIRILQSFYFLLVK